MLVGYARVSTEDQRLDLQIQALEAVGCRFIYKDRGQSGAKLTRAGLNQALLRLKPGGTLVVWRLDRLGRSLSGLVKLMDDLREREVHFRSVTESIDTASSGGKLMFHMMAALAEFERSIISERTRAGLDAARRRGSKVGRPKLLTPDQLKAARHAIHFDQASPGELATELGISSRTLKRHLAV